MSQETRTDTHRSTAEPATGEASPHAGAAPVQAPPATSVAVKPKHAPPASAGKPSAVAYWQRPSAHRNLDISVFVDGANFFYMQRDRLRWWIDPKKLLDWVANLGTIVDAYYYVGVDGSGESRQEAFLEALTYMGYSLVTKDLKTIVQDDGQEVRKANLDIEIVLDMFSTIETYDMAVLISGNGDFERPLQVLRARGKRFMVISTQGTVARELREAAGMHLVDFNSIRGEVEKTR